MLSVLIPVHNYNVVPLVKSVFQQCRKLKIEYEILVFDDFSKEEFRKKNRIISSMFKINYMELSENLGRSRIRNWLAKSARYDYVLFLDCDSKIRNSKFIANYIAHLPNDHDIIHGGRNYGKKPPRAKSKFLHWYYGTKRESKNAKTRTKNSPLYFHSNNFIIRKRLIRQYPFDETLDGYGYEDLIMGQKMKKEHASFFYIDNPIEHLGLEKTPVFIQKSINSIENLIAFEKKGIYLNTRLQQFEKKLTKFRLKKKIQKFLSKNIYKLEENIKSQSPNLRKFDAFKLYHYLRLKDEV